MTWAVNRSIRAISPKLFIIMETEIWPNLVTCLYKKDIPVIMINGRISPGSFERYMHISRFMKPVLKKFKLFCMQNEDYAEKIKKIGAPQENVLVTGNMKFDSAAKISSTIDEERIRKELNLSGDEMIFIAGSTHQGEDEIVLNVYKNLIKEFPILRLIIAPRHTERTKDIEELAGKKGFVVLRVSSPKPKAHSPKPKAQSPKPKAQSPKPIVFILDIMGRLSHFYSIADIVFIGGSLIPKGGQNILEPAVLGKPIVFGPNMFNFKELAELFLERKAAYRVQDEKELFNVSKNLLSNGEARKTTGLNAKEAAATNIGASLRNLAKVERYV